MNSGLFILEENMNEQEFTKVCKEKVVKYTNKHRMEVLYTRTGF